MNISFLMITIDRFELSSGIWRHNLATARRNLPADYKFEGLVCDNGSSDPRIVDYFRPAHNNLVQYQRRNARNEGVGKAFNQLFLRSTGDYIAIMGNDIEMPSGWMKAAIEMLERVPKSGLVGFDWGHSGMPPVTHRYGVDAHFLTPQLNRVFGTWVFRRSMVEEIGLFYEGYGPYGIEDSDVNERLNRAGYNSCYIPGMKSAHLAHDVGKNTAYRKMKDESLMKNLAIFGERQVKWNEGASLIEPLPPMRDPLV